MKAAVRSFKKALELDEKYVDGLGNVYFYDDLEKAKQYYQKVFDLAKKHFNGKWPPTIQSSGQSLKTGSS